MPSRLSARLLRLLVKTVNEHCARCGKPAGHIHHRKRRSQGGDNSPANLVPLCVLCHDWVHRNPEQAYREGWLVRSWQDPAEVPAVPLPVGPEFSAPQNLEPGKPCPTCERRVPHPKKPTTPKTKTFSVRVPVDDAETFNELIDATAEHLGIKQNPYHKYNALLIAMTLALQTPVKDLGIE